jgi:hypothetical protein
MRPRIRAGNLFSATLFQINENSPAFKSNIRRDQQKTAGGPQIIQFL